MDIESVSLMERLQLGAADRFLNAREDYLHDAAFVTVNQAELHRNFINGGPIIPTLMNITFGAAHMTTDTVRVAVHSLCLHLYNFAEPVMVTRESVKQHGGVAALAHTVLDQAGVNR